MTKTRRCYKHFGIVGPPTIAFYGAAERNGETSASSDS